MRISFNRNSALAKARLLTNDSSEKNKNTTVRTKYSNKSSLISSLNNKRKATSKYKTPNTATSTQTKNNYTEMKNAADSLQAHVKKLMEKGEAKLVVNKDKVIKEINSFIEDYNTMVKKMNSIGGTINNLYVNHMKKYAAQERLALKNVGITQASNGTLSVNQDTLKSADTENLQKVFGTKNGFADKVGERSKSVKANAENEIITLSKQSYTTSSNYNRYGNSYGNYESSGSRYQKRG